MGATSQNKEKFEDYEGFTAKFKPKKKTTDDCYTPPDVYKAVKDWCIKENNWGGGRLSVPFIREEIMRTMNIRKIV